MKIISWNVNGLRAIEKKGLLDPLFSGEWDIIALQETKIQPDQLTETLKGPDTYASYWSSAKRKGYSGTGLYIKKELVDRHKPTIARMDAAEFDEEGRTLIADFDHFVLVNCYFPNSQSEGKRLDYKLSFNRAIHERCNELSRSHSRPVILCGDYNVAHRPIDLARPEDNEKSPGYLPEERDWMEEFLKTDYCDTFRHFHPDRQECYSWWSYQTKARERNVGWRIDYHCINRQFTDRLAAAEILSEIHGSDHCPVSVELNL